MNFHIPRRFHTWIVPVLVGSFVKTGDLTKWGGGGGGVVFHKDYRYATLSSGDLNYGRPFMPLVGGGFLTITKIEL